MTGHLLNLRALADANLDDYALLSFEGREEISAPFEYELELIATAAPDLKGWVGKLVEFDVSPGHGTSRIFAGRIYRARRVVSDGFWRIHLSVGPAYRALGFARATHCIQDKNSLDIFDAMTGDLSGLVKSVDVAPTPPVRGYAFRYDETELDFLDRLLAQDGIMYFFTYDRGSGPYRHKMVISNKAAGYIDAPGGPVKFHMEGTYGRGDQIIDKLARQVQAGPGAQKHHALNANKADTPFTTEISSTNSWGVVYAHEYETIGFESVSSADVTTRSSATNEHLSNSGDTVHGSSIRPDFQAGGRVEITGTEGFAPQKVVFTSVVHSAYDPWMLESQQTARYSNQFVAIDATRIYRPKIAQVPRVAPGPLIATVQDDASAEGKAVVDSQFRIPVVLATARDYSDKSLPKFIWVPVQQQWAHSTHGAQFIPRIGSRVVIDFLYGNPDLPIVTGSIYNPTQKYPFDLPGNVTQTGWRSVSDSNGSVTQEFRFEDKPGSEEIYLFTGRDYRRMIENDDFGTVKHDQTLLVENDQKLTVNNDRTVKIEGKQKTDVTMTRTLTVTQKSLHESQEEIELKVGPSSITLTMQGIKIKAPQIEITADTQLKMSGGATAELKAPMVDVGADAKLTLKGGMVMIN